MVVSGDFVFILLFLTDNNVQTNFTVSVTKVSILGKLSLLYSFPETLQFNSDYIIFCIGNIVILNPSTSKILKSYDILLRIKRIIYRNIVVC